MQDETDNDQLRLTRSHLARIIAGAAAFASAAQDGVFEAPCDSAGVHGFARQAPGGHRPARGRSWDEGEPGGPDGPEPEAALACGPRPSAPPGGALADLTAGDVGPASNAVGRRPRC